MAYIDDNLKPGLAHIAARAALKRDTDIMPFDSNYEDAMKARQTAWAQTVSRSMQAAIEIQQVYEKLRHIPAMDIHMAFEIYKESRKL